VNRIGPSSTVASNRLRFALVHAARSLGWSSVDLMLAWHLHVVVGFSGPSVSYLLFACLAVGSSTSFAVGWLLSKHRATGRTYVRLQLVGAMASGTLLAAQFLSMNQLWAVVISIAFRIAYSVQDVPQNALASMLPEDGDDSKVYARLHMTLSSAARLVVIGAHLLFLENGAIDRHVAITVMAVAMSASAFGLLGARFPHGFGFAGALLPALSRMLIFSPDASSQIGFGSWMLAAFYVGSIAGPTVHARLAAVMDEHQACAIWTVAAMIGGAIMILPIGPVFREVSAAVHGLALNAIGVRLWARAAHVAREEAGGGFVFGAVIPTLHVSSALGALLMGPLIEPYENGSALAAVSALTMTSLGAMLILLLDVRRRRALAWA
jgi:hypothetical protein